MKKLLTIVSIPAMLAASACGDDALPSAQPDAAPSPTPTPEPEPEPLTEAPSTYAFPSRSVSGQSAVAYSGQVGRHSLIAGLANTIGGWAADKPAPEEARAALMFFYDFEASGSDTAIDLATREGDAPLLQNTYGELFTATSLRKKFAGNDTGDVYHRDWSSEFVGWQGYDNAESLLLHWIDQLVNLPVGYVDQEGRDYQQLIQKFLLMAVTFSQATDDYLDDFDSPDTNADDASGLNASNVVAADEAYSELEHHWDEGFGYFGAARDYNAYTDEEIAGKGGRPGWDGGYHDSDDDGRIDLTSEWNFGASTNAAKRDLGSAATAPTDFSKTIMDAFLQGRFIIWSADGELTQEQRAALLTQRDIIVRNWEKAIAATIVHYINEVLVDMNRAPQDYSLADHAKHWSELKGFALGLQFSPFSPLSEDDFAELHRLVADAPVLRDAPAAEQDAYRAALRQARTLLGDAYDFDAANLGDDDGENGW